MFHRFEVAMFPVVEKPMKKKQLFSSIANPTTQVKFNCPKEKLQTQQYFVQNWVKICCLDSRSTLYKSITLSLCLHYSDFKRGDTKIPEKIIIKHQKQNNKKQMHF